MYTVSFKKDKKIPLGLRLRSSQPKSNRGARVVLVRNKSLAHNAGVLPGSLVVSINDTPCVSEQMTYDEILCIMKSAPRPLKLVLSVSKTPSQQLASLSERVKRAVLSIFAITLGDASTAGRWSSSSLKEKEKEKEKENGKEGVVVDAVSNEYDYVRTLLRQTCGTFGFDEEQSMNFLPLLSMNEQGADISTKDACSGFLPHLSTSPQVTCQTIMNSLALNLLTCESYDARARTVWRKFSNNLGFDDEWFAREEHLMAVRCQMEIDLLSDGAAAAENEVRERTIESETTTWSRWKKGLKIGGAVVVGGTLIALTAGLAAPAVAGGVAAVGTGLGISAATAGVVTFLSSTGGVIVLTSIFGTAGGGLTGGCIDRAGTR